MPVIIPSQRAIKIPELSKILLLLFYSGFTVYQSVAEAIINKSKNRTRIPIAVKIEDMKLLQFKILNLIRTNIET